MLTGNWAGYRVADAMQEAGDLLVWARAFGDKWETGCLVWLAEVRAVQTRMLLADRGYRLVKRSGRPDGHAKSSADERRLAAQGYRPMLLDPRGDMALSVFGFWAKVA